MNVDKLKGGLMTKAYMEDVYRCEFIRTGSEKRAINNLSEEGRAILGFPSKALSAKINNDYKNRWRAYRFKVWKLTEEKAHLITDIHKRGFRDHHIDHKISIWYGFKNGLTVDFIADLDNLRMLPYKENMKKGTRNHV
jgi:hypothetical protein